MKAKEYAEKIKSAPDEFEAVKSVFSDLLKEGQDLMDKRPGNPMSCIWESHQKFQAIISRLDNKNLNEDAFLFFVTRELDSQGVDVSEFKDYLKKKGADL